MTTGTWTQIEALFLEAIDLAPEERARFLDRACGENRALRAELDSLLAQDEARDDPIAAALAEEAALLLKPALQGGERIGAYRILREIGRGGMGAVYLAERDDDQYRQQVAIKLVKRGMDTAEVLRAFRDERQILAGLEHPYIARLLDGGSTADGRPFLAMELVEGAPIDVYCTQHGLEVEERCRLFLKVCEALSYAHRKLVAHRDLKPRNILVAGEGSGNPGCPKLLDFGLAKLLAAGGEGDDMRARSRPLTPDYASPEQIRGLALNTSTDIYSLGVILHELLTGARPHELAGMRPREWERVVCEAEVAPPSSRCQGRLRARLTGDLDNILMKALRKDAERRYRSVDEFAADIRAYLECRPVVARADSLWYRSVKFARRRKLPLAAAAVALAGLLGGTVVAVVQARDAQRARRMAEARQRQAQQARHTAEAEHALAKFARDTAVADQRRAEERMTQMLSLSERSLSDVYTLIERLPGAGPARRELVSTTLGFLEELARGAGANLRLRIALAKAYLRMGDLQVDPGADRDGGLQSYLAGIALLEGSRQDGAFDRERLLVWVTLERQAGMLVFLTDPGEAHRRLGAALAALEQVPAGLANDADFVRLRATLYHGLAAAGHADLSRARQYAAQYLAAMETLAARNPRDSDLEYELSAAHVELGFVLWALGNPEATASHYRKAVELREHLVELRPNDAVYRRALALAYEHLGSVEGGRLVNSLGRTEEALRWYRKALPLVEAAAVDPKNPIAARDYATLLVRLAGVEGSPAESEESLTTARRASDLLDALRSDSDRLDAYVVLGDRLREMGRYQEAVTQYRRAMTFAGTLPDTLRRAPAATERIMQAESGMARTLALAGDRAGALEHAARLARVAPAASPDQTVLESPAALAYVTLAAVQRTLGEWDGARAAAEQALASAPPSASWDPNGRIVREAREVIAESTAQR